MSSGANAKVVRDNVWVASLRSHPKDSSDISGRSEHRACIQMHAYKWARLTFSVNDFVDGGRVDRLLTDFDGLLTLFFHTFCRVCDMFLL